MHRFHFHACTLVTFGLLSTATVAADSSAQKEKIAFCVGTIEGGYQLEINIWRSKAGKVFGSVAKNGRLARSQGFALELERIEAQNDARPDMIEYKLQSNLVFASDTNSFYTMFLYADRASHEVSGKQFIFHHRKNRTPRSGMLECAGTMP